MWTDCSTTVVLEILEVSKNGITKREIIDKLSTLSRTIEKMSCRANR